MRMFVSGRIWISGGIWTLIATLLTLNAPNAATGAVTYAYDALGRLVTATYDTGVCIAYTYDPVGNRLSETIQVPSPTGTGIWNCSTWDSTTWGT